MAQTRRSGTAKARANRRLGLGALMTAAWLPAGLSLTGYTQSVVETASLLAVPFVLAAALAWVGPSRSLEPLHVRGRQQKRIVVIAVLIHLALVALTQWPLRLALLLSTPALNHLVERKSAQHERSKREFREIVAEANAKLNHGRPMPMCGNARDFMVSPEFAIPIGTQVGMFHIGLLRRYETKDASLQTCVYLTENPLSDKGLVFTRNTVTGYWEPTDAPTKPW